jgi:lipoprotein NlpD
VSPGLRERSTRTRGIQTLGIAWLVVLATLAGCSTLSYEPSSAPRGDSRTYVVRKGDTLFKIAWQHGVDQRDLARWNGIRDPDVIHVGQRIRLTAAGAAAARGADAPAQTSAKSSPQSKSASPPRSTKSGGAAPPRPVPPPVSTPVLPAPAWAWPTDGAVVTRFGAADGIATGISIGGREGQPVRAAAAGRVVYAGSGLMSYGQLLIIKHNDTYLTAYGYNSMLLVAQGQDVAKGQTIAAMGRGPEREPRLHFEIRRNGTPIDPLLLVAEK